MRLAYAVVRDDPPRVLAADSLEVLHRVIALEVVASSSSSALPAPEVRAIREALLDERWADAVTHWMEHSGLAVDVYDDLEVWTDERVDRDLTTVKLQFAPLFRDD